MLLVREKVLIEVMRIIIKFDMSERYIYSQRKVDWFLEMEERRRMTYG